MSNEATEGHYHVVVVDDDPEIRKLVARYLKQHGMSVTAVRDIVGLRGALAGAPVNLVVLDILLPGPSGLDICKEIRQSSAVPIVMLTARGEEVDRVIGLELGADDYITKPFSPRELLARIRAVLRRTQGAAQPAEPAPRLLAFDGWMLDVRRRELTAPDGAAVELSGAEHDLLVVFLDHPQRVLSRDELAELTKGRGAGPLDRTIDLQVSRLRRKLEPDPAAPHLIKTVRSAGYYFVPEVERR